MVEAVDAVDPGGRKEPLLAAFLDVVDHGELDQVEDDPREVTDEEDEDDAHEDTGGIDLALDVVPPDQGAGRLDPPEDVDVEEDESGHGEDAGEDEPGDGHLGQNPVLLVINNNIVC